mgnify:CR=1 FL=1
MTEPSESKKYSSNMTPVDQPKSPMAISKDEMISSLLIKPRLQTSFTSGFPTIIFSLGIPLLITSLTEVPVKNPSLDLNKVS